MFRKIFENIEEINWLPEITLVFFLLFFIAIVWFALTLDKGVVNHMKNLPLEDSDKYHELK